MSKYKDRFTEKYQRHVGFTSAESFLHQNSKELAQFLVEQGIIKDHISIFEIGAAGCRNLKYIYDINNTIKMFANDLHEQASRKNMHPDLLEKVVFFEIDTLSLVEKDLSTVVPGQGLDLLLSSDHLMHIDSETALQVLTRVKTEWVPEHICLRELVSDSGQDLKRTFPRVKHEYKDILGDTYDLIAEKQCEKNKPEWFSIMLFKKRVAK